MLPTLNGFAKKVSDLPDKPSAIMSAADLKAQFDAAPEELRVFVNQLSKQIEQEISDLRDEVRQITRDK